MAMTALRRRLLEDRQLRGLAPRTQPWYLEAVTHLTHHDRRAPDQMSEAELRQYFLFLINDTQVAERTLRVHLDGIRFFSERTVQRPWPVFDLFVPRAPRGLALWRAYWRRQRPRPWVFPARDGSAPLSPTALHKPCTAVVRQSAIPKEASIQTRRHASATHLLERGGSLRVIQERLGHKSPRTTARSTHLTPPTLALVHAPSTTLMADL
jgi:hypothetical protein